MYAVSPDRKNNCLYVILKGFVSKEESIDMRYEVAQKVKQLQPGLTLITDISECKPATQEVFQNFKQSHNMVAEYGAKRIIRIIGNKITSLQLQRSQREATGDQIQVIEVNSFDEAERLLHQDF